MKKLYGFRRKRKLSFMYRQLLLTMKLTAIFLTVISLGVSARSFSQTVTYKGKKVSIEKVFTVFEKQTGYVFFYNDADISKVGKMNVSLKDEQVQNALDLLLKDHALTYNIEGKTIFIHTLSGDNVSPDKSPFADTLIAIQGQIKDASTGDPLPGVTIQVKGSTLGTTTDSKGFYRLNVPKDAVLIVSFIGYQKREITLNGRSELDITLSPSTTGLNQLVVVGYGTQKKASLTSAVSSISGQQIITTKNENVENMLTGKVPGLFIQQNTAEPGDFSNNISIRGMGHPLIVVDGVEMPDFNVTGGNGDNDVGSSNILTRLDPNDIESISVLKDAAASIYGVKAANGVILITTKKGTEGTLQLSYTGTVGEQVPSGLPKPVNAIQYMTLVNQQYMHNANGGRIVYIPADFQAYQNGKEKSTDWYDATFKKSALQQQHNLTATGGSQNIQYFFSGGYTSQDGFLKSDALNYKRYNVRSNITSQISRRITVNLNLSAIQDQKNSPAQSFWWTTRETWRELPTQTIYANNNPQYLSNGFVDGGNPIAYMDPNVNGYSTQTNRFFNGSLSIDYKMPFIDGLTLRGFYSYNLQIQDNKLFQKSYSLYNYDGSTDSYNASLKNSPSSVQRQYYEYPQNTDQFSFNYDHVFNGVHHVSALLLYEGNEQSADNFEAYRQLAIPVDQIIAGNSANQQATQGNGELYQYATNSIVGRATYSYANKYLGEFSFRRDASSKFAPSQKWGFFPSGSLGWVVSQEDFWKNSPALSFIDNLKLRASYGVLGDDGSLYYQFLTGYNYPANGDNNRLPGGAVFNNTFVNAVQSTGLPNPNITWSTSRTFDAGIDFDAWNGKLGFTFDYFVRNRKGLFASPVLQVPDVLGASLPQENLNGDRTRGFDFDVSHEDHIGEFHYDIKGTFSFARTMNTIVAEQKHGNSYLDWRDNQSNRYQGIQWGYGADGQYQNYNQILNSPVAVGRGTVVGDYAYQDWNGDGQIDGNDVHPIAYGGNPNGGPLMPLITYGLTLSGSYDGFDVNLLFQGVGVYNVSYIEQLNIPLWGGGSALTQFLDNWHPADPNADPYAPNTKWIPGNFSYTGTTANIGSLFNFHSAAYMRLKSLEIGYSLPQNVLSHIGIKGIRIFVNGYNLFTITKLKYVDPEHPSGMYGYLYPLDKLYNVGLNVKF
ncbi:MAG: SusC/RagA family TonB-linked outer membrane protein [Chitinophagaceae bacterium]|nr:MAG: SusC/RagA family TonB-linked outer membrane protein [Chitinophagaceae bacterium]